MSVYAIDFDGTLCTNTYPEIGEPKFAVIERLIALRACGNKLILNTCREGELLKKAKLWCAVHGLTFFFIQQESTRAHSGVWQRPAQNRSRLLYR